MHPWQPWGWSSDQAHRQYLHLKALHEERAKRPKPKLVLREIPEPSRDKDCASQHAQTSEVVDLEE